MPKKHSKIVPKKWMQNGGVADMHGHCITYLATLHISFSGP